MKSYRRVKIKDMDSGEVFNSASDLAIALKCSRSAVSNHLNGRYPTVRGRRFERIEEISD